MKSSCLVVIVFLVFPFVDAACEVSYLDPDVMGANIHLREGRYDRAIGLYKKVERKNPNDVLLTVALATSYYMKKDYREAVNYLDKTVEMDKEKVQGKLRDYEERVDTKYLKWQIFYNGAVEYFKDEPEKGINLAKKSLEVEDPTKVSQSYNLLANMVLKVGKKEEAIKLLMKAIEADKKNVDAYMTLGHLYLTDSDTEKALKYFNGALEIDSTKIKIYELIGQAHLLDKEYAEAIKSLEKALSITGKSPTLLYNLMLAHYEAKNYDEAINNGKEVLGLDDVEPRVLTGVYNLMGQVYQDSKDYKNVVALMKEAVDKGLGNCDSYSLIAHAYYKLGDNKTSSVWSKKWEECEKNK